MRDRVVLVVVRDDGDAPGRRSPPGRCSCGLRRRRTPSARRSSPGRGASGRPPPVTSVAPSLAARRDVALTRSRWRAMASGPICVSRIERVADLDRCQTARDVQRPRTSCVARRGTRTRVRETHTWPVMRNGETISGGSAASKSASSSTMAADLPPSSRRDAGEPLARRRRRCCLPAAVLPVKRPCRRRGDARGSRRLAARRARG